jgi:hypothetical protein
MLDMFLKLMKKNVRNTNLRFVGESIISISLTDLKKKKNIDEYRRIF